ncbi:hypothetical protein ACIP01_11250 [Pseudomonas monteilii]|uniref:hypothetical protein n=1 Tax=Pseudomonas monteilii TaxID=76759 RepID=UPI003820F15C
MAAKAALKKISPLFAERAAGKAPETVQSVDKAIAQTTIERLVGGNPADTLGSRALNAIAHTIITPEYLNNPNVKNWLNDQRVIDDLEQGGRLMSLGKPLPNELLSRLQAGYEEAAFSGAQESMGVVLGIIAMLAQSTISRIADHGNASLTIANYRELSTEIEELRGALEHHHPLPQAVEVTRIITDGLDRNIAWLSEAFGSSKRARSVFGQALSPGDESFSKPFDRKELRTEIASKIFESASGAVIGLLGGDGNGKSWIFAQAWMKCDDRPLTIIIVPDDINGTPSLEYCHTLLVSKILTQTKEIETLESKEHWLKVLKYWQSEPDPNTPNLVLLLDGINQRDSINWAQFIDTMSEVLAQLGGTLVFSSRQIFYKDHIQTKLSHRVIPVEIPEWTPLELDNLLKDHGASISDLNSDVVRSLRNPRIFGIAIKLFNSKQITEFNELSINRLLFEHIRNGAVESSRVSDTQFKADICAHAESIVQRLNDQQLVDINEFEINSLATDSRVQKIISDKFTITSAGRFFEVTEENPNKYTLKDEGLPLALGLALVRTAREAYRKQKSVEDALSTILDPIAALDKTSNVLMGAILAAVLEELPSEITSLLIRSFAMLQNIDRTHYPEFRTLFSINPGAFLMALENSTISNDAVSNLSWLTDAANDLRDHKVFEEALSFSIHRWLNMYSLSPDRMMMLTRTPENAVEYSNKWEDRKAELEKIITSLSEPESKLLNTMIRIDHGNYSNLSLLAFQALAGRPLAPFALSLRNWCFANAINGGYRSHHDDFDNLLHFNVADWLITKSKLQESATVFQHARTSRTGQWALVSILRATGDSDDACRANSIAEELTKDREKYQGWRLVENYCASDPCDPSSEEPDNIDITAHNYAAIDLAKICAKRSQSTDDHFFEKAQPGLARFRPKAAIETLRALADHALTRDTAEFRLAANMLRSHTVGLKKRATKLYIEKAAEIAQSSLDNGTDENNEAWVAAQHALSVAFAHLSGDEQLAALLNHPKDKSILFDLAWLLQPVEPSVLDRAINTAIQEDNQLSQFRILFFAEYSKTSISTEFKTIALALIKSSDHLVRLSTLSLIHAVADPILLKGLVNSEWSAAHLDAIEHKMEILYGAQALSYSLELGFLTIDEFLSRAPFCAYETLPISLGAKTINFISKYLDSAISRAIAYETPENLPCIEQNFEGRYSPVVLSVSESASERASAAQDFSTHLDRLSETSDAWYRRQKLSRDRADDFEKKITAAGAQIIVKSVTASLIVAIDQADKPLIDSWLQQFLNLSDSSLSNVHNIALMIAEVVSRRDPLAGLQLYCRLKNNSSHVKLTYGRTKTEADALSSWRAADSDEIKSLCFARLDSMSNDHDLAMEILAAIRADRLKLIRDYVIDRRQRAEPAYRARAVMVAGLSPDEEWATSTIEMFKEEKGFLQQAYKAAKYSMDRHQWSRHWASKIRQAESAEDVWRFTILLSKIVDGRYCSSDIMGDKSTPLIERFGVTLEDQIHNRIRKWKSKRKPKLFGMNAPAKSLIVGYRDPR